MAVITDKRTLVVDIYQAEVISAQDYYPFGMIQPGKNFSIGNYRYGFNGKENDNEVKGLGNSIDFGARIYDSRIGRWLSVDPLETSEAGWTPYRYNFNSPFLFMDEHGEIEIPLKAIALYDPVALLRVEKAFLVKTKTGRVFGDKHYIEPNTSTAHKGQWYQFAYIANGSNRMNEEQRSAAANGMLARVNSGFFKSRSVGTSPHIGTDLKASIGTDIYSFGNGKVTETGYTDGTGQYMVIEYSNGDKVRFMHLSKKLLAKEQNVSEGQAFARTGNSGYRNKSKGQHHPPHLHVDGADKYGKMIDPLKRTYGTVSNEEFFYKYDGDWKKLQDAKTFQGTELPEIKVTPKKTTNE